MPQSNQEWEHLATLYLTQPARVGRCLELFGTCVPAVARAVLGDAELLLAIGLYNAKDGAAAHVSRRHHVELQPWSRPTPARFVSRMQSRTLAWVKICSYFSCMLLILASSADAGPIDRISMIGNNWDNAGRRNGGASMHAVVNTPLHQRRKPRRHRSESEAAHTGTPPWSPVPM